MFLVVLVSDVLKLDGFWGCHFIVLILFSQFAFLRAIAKV
jgi:hypothetical protein